MSHHNEGLYKIGPHGRFEADMFNSWVQFTKPNRDLTRPDPSSYSYINFNHITQNVDGYTVAAYVVYSALMGKVNKQ